MSRLERFVEKKLLQRLELKGPEDIDLTKLCNSLNIELHIVPLPTHLFGTQQEPGIILDSRLPLNKQRVALAHEICHFAAHCGIQLTLPKTFRDLQESESNCMALYLLMPTGLIRKLVERTSPKLSHRSKATQIAHLFFVPYDIASKRLMLFEHAMRRLDLGCTGTLRTTHWKAQKPEINSG